MKLVFHAHQDKADTQLPFFCALAQNCQLDRDWIQLLLWNRHTMRTKAATTSTTMPTIFRGNDEKEIRNYESRFCALVVAVVVIDIIIVVGSVAVASKKCVKGRTITRFAVRIHPIHLNNWTKWMCSRFQPKENLECYAVVFFVC